MSGKNNIENLDLTKILKYCPKGWKFYTSVWGEVEFKGFSSESVDFLFDSIVGNIVDVHININGTYCGLGECIIFPSKEQRDWSKFTAPWYKKDKFDPKTLKSFDKILVRRYDDIWTANLLSHYYDVIHPIEHDIHYLEFMTISNGTYRWCIPYNDETKHLVGTSNEAPEYYRYWEVNCKQK